MTLSHEEQLHMLQAARRMVSVAYAPYSNFFVGACIKAASGRYYAGCNIENASYSLVQCAEATAIAHMVAAGEKQITAAVIVSSGPMFCAPCGACRQRFREFSSGQMSVYMYNNSGEFLHKHLEELLPHSFGPTHLEVVV